jgi:hypothetical protein
VQVNINIDNESKLSKVADVVRRHYGETIWQAIKAGIGVVTSMSLKERDHCLVLIYEGASGQGKSIAVRVFMPYESPSDENSLDDEVCTSRYLHRVDDFTSAAFVSHAANRKRTELQGLDLLPKVKGKVMLTKELAPIFRGDEKELRNNFARLTSILDGNGFMSASGVHGRRGYEGRFVFNWLGATTPIPDHTHKIMAQLGNRLLFYRIESDEVSVDELVKFAASYNGNDTVQECQVIINKFIGGYFSQHPVESIEPASITIAPDLLTELVCLAKLVAHGRIAVEHSQWPETGMEVGEPEGPQRIILLFQTLVRGLALADGRLFVAAEDLQTIRHIAFSSIPRKRRELLYAVLSKGGALLDAGQVQRVLRVSRPTAHVRMKELGATAIVRFTDGNEKTSTPATLMLADDWRWLLKKPP